MWLDGKSILITGGTGSFGRAFIAHVLRHHSPRRVIVYSRDELKQWEMRQQFDSPVLRYFIGDVRDRDRLFRAFADVDYIVHAAALKQVPAAEYNPFEAVKTNILGAQNIIEAAIDRGVKRVVALSSDKAANPINLYGATKLVSDKLFIAGNAYAGAGDTRFGVVRYGNVLGSRGSVVSFFKKSRDTGVLPITDVHMTRFWLTLDQAIRYVVRFIQDMRRGEIFVPKLPSMRVVDLARAIAPDAEVREVGIRPGEKLHEVLVPIDEARLTLEYANHYIVRPAFGLDSEAPLPGGRPVHHDFHYSSDQNDLWIDRPALLALLGEPQPSSITTAPPTGAREAGVREASVREAGVREAGVPEIGLPEIGLPEIKEFSFDGNVPQHDAPGHDGPSRTVV